MYFLLQFYISLVKNTVLYSVAPSIIHHYHCCEATDLILLSATCIFTVNK